jgi:hypothetical protein
MISAIAAFLSCMLPVLSLVALAALGLVAWS